MQLTRLLSLTRPAILGLALYAAAGTAYAESFDDLDAELEAEFEQLDADLEAQYQALDAALEAAYERLEDEVKAVWGESETQLSDQKNYVDYSEDKSLRRKIDFDKGVVTVEAVLDAKTNPEQLSQAIQSAAGTLVTDTLSDLADKDQALAYAREAMAVQNIALEPYKPEAAAKPVLGSIAKDMPKPDVIDQLVKKAINNDKTNSGGQAIAGKATAKVSQISGAKKKVSIEVPLRFGFQSSLAGRYQDMVLKEARSQSIAPSLIYAVMETESSFNPRARSGVPAFGLMQLVPKSGAMDAYLHVYGEKTLLDPEYLYDAGQNVELGTAYLHVLYNRYLRHISNAKSREYCAIAAYNTGSGNVARSFTGKTNVKAAAKIINRMTPDEVYAHLIKNLPYDETRRYLRKVTKAQKKYQGVDRYL